MTLLAVATVVLALFTAWLALENHKTRTEAARTRKEEAFRAALVELLDDCRIWSHADPSTSAKAARYYADHPPRLAAVETLLAHVTLPGPLLARLLWQVAAAHDAATRTVASAVLLFPEGTTIADGGADADKAQARQSEEVKSFHGLALDHLQVAACLVRCEARRQGFEDLARAFEGLPWLSARPQWNRIEREQLYDVPSFGAPEFPTDLAYARCAPPVRHDEGEQHRQDEERLRAAGGSGPLAPTTRASFRNVSRPSRNADGTRRGAA